MAIAKHTEYGEVVEFARGRDALPLKVDDWFEEDGIVGFH